MCSRGRNCSGICSACHCHRTRRRGHVRGRRSGGQVEMPARVQPLPVAPDEHLGQPAAHHGFALRVSPLCGEITADARASRARGVAVSYLGEFEQLVLFAVLRLDQDASGIAIHDAIEARTGRDVSRARSTPRSGGSKSVASYVAASSHRPPRGSAARASTTRSGPRAPKRCATPTTTSRRSPSVSCRN